ncbi:MAG: sulfatase-like hydrolase/transferase [Planctomycetota bacterium]
MRRRDFLKFVSLGITSITVGGCGLDKFGSIKSNGLPNIVIILSDDLGYAELSCQGAKDLTTPNIDSLARDGIRCTDAYSSGPVCAPTRAGLMTGRYQNRFGYQTLTGSVQRQIEEDLGVPVSEIFFSQIIQKAGYKTAMIGKWHLGHNEKYRPYKRGFDEFFGFLPGGHDYFEWDCDIHPTASGLIYRNEEPQKQPPKGEGYLTDVFSDEAVSFIERNHSRPFLLYLAYNAVHTPLQVPEKYTRNLPDNLSEKRKKMIGMTHAMDAGIGRVLDALRKKGIEKNTLVIFFNDNGGVAGMAGVSNAPLSGSKVQLKEGGIRVAFMLRWPGKINAGKIYDKPIISLDVFPMVVAAAQQQLPEDRKIDGINLLPYFRGEKKGSPHEYLFFRHVGDYAVRKGNFKLYISKKDKNPRLFNLHEDIAEKNDLSDKFPEVVKKLKDALIEWESEMTPPQTEMHILKSRLTYRAKEKK